MDSAESSSGESDLDLLTMPAGTKKGKRITRTTEAVSYEALQAAGYAQVLSYIHQPTPLAQLRDESPGADKEYISLVPAGLMVGLLSRRLLKKSAKRGNSK